MLQCRVKSQQHLVQELRSTLDGDTVLRISFIDPEHRYLTNFDIRGTSLKAVLKIIRAFELEYTQNLHLLVRVRQWIQEIRRYDWWSRLRVELKSSLSRLERFDFGSVSRLSRRCNIVLH